MPTASKPQVKLVRKRLDAEALQGYFEDLAAGARVVEVRVKQTAGARSVASSSDLPELARGLAAAEIVAVQLRFQRDGEWWCDTVMRAGVDFRLVRMPES